MIALDIWPSKIKHKTERYKKIPEKFKMKK